MLPSPRPSEGGREEMHGFRRAQVGLPERRLVSVCLCIPVFSGFSSPRYAVRSRPFSHFRRLGFTGYAHNNLAQRCRLSTVTSSVQQVMQLLSCVQSAVDECGDSGAAGLDRMDDKGERLEFSARREYSQSLRATPRGCARGFLGFFPTWRV